MPEVGFMWECSCGHLEAADQAPEECPECFALDSFLQLPEEIAKEREKDLAQNQYPEDLV